MLDLIEYRMHKGQVGCRKLSGHLSVDKREEVRSFDATAVPFWPTDVFSGVPLLPTSTRRCVTQAQHCFACTAFLRYIVWTVDDTQNLTFWRLSLSPTEDKRR